MTRLKSLGGAVLGRIGSHDVTGLAAMVAYNLATSLIPFSILALWISGHLLDSASVEQAVVHDLTSLFPSSQDGTLRTFFANVQTGTAAIGLASLAFSIWSGMSFWGALDTSFGRIYSLPKRGWLAQKRFAFGMLWLFMLFIVATVAVPVAQSAIASVRHDLPFGLDEVPGSALVSSLAVGVFVLFMTLWAIYALGPNGRLPWRAVLPGAAFTTAVITVLDYVYPLYLTKVSNVWRFGTTVVFLVIVLAWFYAVAFVILLGAELNSALLDRHDRAEREGDAQPTRSEAISLKQAT